MSFSTARCRTIRISRANWSAISRPRCASASRTRSQAHRLRREIIATQLANAIVNRGGPTLVTRLVDQTGADAPAIAAAYAATRDAFGLTELNAAIDALDGGVPGALQLRLYGDLQDLLMSRMVWFIRNVDLDARVARRRRRHLPRTASPRSSGRSREPCRRRRTSMWRKRTQELVAEGAPEDLARRLAALPDLVAAPDIVLVAQRTGRPVDEVARTHFARRGHVPARRDGRRGAAASRSPTPTTGSRSTAPSTASPLPIAA